MSTSELILYVALQPILHTTMEKKLASTGVASSTPFTPRAEIKILLMTPWNSPDKTMGIFIAEISSQCGCFSSKRMDLCKTRTYGQGSRRKFRNRSATCDCTRTMNAQAANLQCVNALYCSVRSPNDQGGDARSCSSLENIQSCNQSSVKTWI